MNGASARSVHVPCERAHERVCELHHETHALRHRTHCVLEQHEMYSKVSGNELLLKISMERERLTIKNKTMRAIFLNGMQTQCMRSRDAPSSRTD